MDGYFSDKELVGSVPVRRAAYSDRTAWVMAEIARLVYEPLPREVATGTMVAAIREAVAAGKDEKAIDALILQAVRGRTEGGTEVEAMLEKGGFEYIDSFVEGGTEALLAKLDSGSGAYLVLAFRGTQPNIKDVRTDMKANLVPAPQGGRVHAGFLEAFDKVKGAIEEALAPHAGMPLYVTGHSLGGALAMIATRYLAPDSVGATYTFGCPRVADRAFYDCVRTPVYRVVNCADSVPRVPFGFGLSILLYTIRLIPFNGTRWLSRKLQDLVGRYVHYGNLIFLSGGTAEKVEARHSPNIFWRIGQVVYRFVTSFGRGAISDHFMLGYSTKLHAVARRRRVVPK